MDELELNDLSIWAEANRQTDSTTMEVNCVFYLREETVVVSVPKPINLNPVVVEISLIDELPIVDT